MRPLVVTNGYTALAAPGAVVWWSTTTVHAAGAVNLPGPQHATVFPSAVLYTIPDRCLTATTSRGIFFYFIPSL